MPLTETLITPPPLPVEEAEVDSGALGEMTVSTLTNWVALPALLHTNGTFVLMVTASSPGGESAPSTNLVVRYYATQPGPVVGLAVR